MEILDRLKKLEEQKESIKQIIKERIERRKHFCDEMTELYEQSQPRWWPFSEVMMELGADYWSITHGFSRAVGNPRFSNQDLKKWESKKHSWLIQFRAEWQRLITENEPIGIELNKILKEDGFSESNDLWSPAKNRLAWACYHPEQEEGHIQYYEKLLEALHAGKTYEDLWQEEQASAQKRREALIVELREWRKSGKPSGEFFKYFRQSQKTKS